MTSDRSYTFRTMPPQTSSEEPPLVAATAPGRYVGSTLPAHFYPEVFFTQLIEGDSLIYGQTIGLYDDSVNGNLVPATPFLQSGMSVYLVPDGDLKESESEGETHQQVDTEHPGRVPHEGLVVHADLDHVEWGEGARQHPPNRAPQPAVVALAQLHELPARSVRDP